MAFRGYFALNGVEIANSSRVVAHVGADIPTSDVGLFTPDTSCALTPSAAGPLLAELSPSMSPIAPGALLATVPDGSRLYGPGMALVGDCWTPENLCFDCRTQIGYDDSWPGLRELLGDGIYRPELAPWYTTRVPESAEFGGIWVMDVTGLDVTPGSREIAEVAGAGGAPGPHRAPSRTVKFDAVLIACTNAGLTYGLQWLATQLNATNTRTDSTLRYLAAHPAHSAADPLSLMREVHGVVLTSGPTINEQVNAGRGEHHQATVYRVSWELTTQPYAYTPPVEFPVEWDEVAIEPIRWVHAGDCGRPSSCDDMPVLFSETCEVERIEVVSTPPPSCGGCMPVCAVETRVFEVPTFDYPLRGTQTATTLRITNTGAGPLTLQAAFRRCNARQDCGDEVYPLQITGLPSTAELVLDGISGRYWVNYAGRKRRPVHIVGTPTGSPWRPAVLDRGLCWEFVATADADASFDVSMVLSDRES